MPASRRSVYRSTSRGPVASLAAAALVAFALTSCGSNGRTATQVAAQVNGEEISVHQINFVLQRTPGLTADRAAEAKHAILERLIEQEVLVQAADASRLDRDPEVLQRLEASKREILARAHLERIAAAVPKPDEKEIAEFFAAQPQLFTKRRVYKFDEVGLATRPANWSELEKQLQLAKTLEEAATVLRQHRIDPAIATNVTRPSEQLPLALLAKFEQLTPGDVVLYPLNSGVVIAQVRAVRTEPVDQKRAGPIIEQFLLNKKRSDAVQAETKRLRDSAQIKYLGEFDVGDPSRAPMHAARPEPSAPGADTESEIDKGVKSLK
ncbi:MAG: EpsD family peptidyl-prolyl cis-trans isomerase [Burkholderiaceae bacterium]|nr:EpsD family peptidyl-prolyl cis-trans isomerase [Burkholderiaceae bacterium]